MTLRAALAVSLLLSGSIAHATTLTVLDGRIASRDDLQWDYSYLLTGENFRLAGLSSSPFPAFSAYTGGT